MKVGILTFHRAINYGAVWQSYALMTYLRNQNVEAEIIDFFPDFLQHIHKHIPKKPWMAISRIVLIRKFNSFVDKYLYLSDKQYKNKNELSNTNSEYDIFITGSDTVWNLNIVKANIGTYLLDFVDKEKIKFSYAASMGGQDATIGNEELFQRNLSGYSSVSLREPVFIERLKGLCFRDDVYEVLDPTLLLSKEDYKKVLDPLVVKNKYIAVINLSGDKKINDLAVSLGKKTGLKLINISGTYIKRMQNPIGLSPVKWLEYIYNAEYVCTDSFHGLCFSLIFEKQFYCKNSTVGFRKHNNIRVLNMLRKFDLENRSIQTDEIEIITEIDYVSIKSKLEELREKSFKFLKSQIV